MPILVGPCFVRIAVEAVNGDDAVGGVSGLQTAACDPGLLLGTVVRRVVRLVCPRKQAEEPGRLVVFRHGAREGNRRDCAPGRGELTMYCSELTTVGAGGKRGCPYATGLPWLNLSEAPPISVKWLQAIPDEGVRRQSCSGNRAWRAG